MAHDYRIDGRWKAIHNTLTTFTSCLVDHGCLMTAIQLDTQDQVDQLFNVFNDDLFGEKKVERRGSDIWIENVIRVTARKS